MTTIRLPTAGGGLEPFRLRAAPARPETGVAWSRQAFAAAHVVVDPLADIDPTLAVAVDWDRTIAYREHLWDLGFSVAEAMDTAQRGMGLDWPLSLELVRRSVAAARARGSAALASGAGTDHLDLGRDLTLQDVMDAYEEQCAAIEAAGSPVILMASRALVNVARTPDDYRTVYGHVLRQLERPAILHWLGAAFDPALAGYWGDAAIPAAMDTALAIIGENAAKVNGIKISLLSADHEISMRRRLPDGVLMYTGDDFNYPELIAGDEHGVSHALLGIFDAIAPVASSALTALASGDRARYDALLAPTLPLSRHMFKAPTRFYKTGVVFLAYLNGFQDHVLMVGGQENARSTLHLAELFRLADAANVLTDPERAADRMRAVMAVRGVAA